MLAVHVDEGDILSVMTLLHMLFMCTVTVRKDAHVIIKKIV